MTPKKLPLALASSLISLLAPLSAQNDLTVTQELSTLNVSSSFAPFTGKVIGNRVRMRVQPSIDSTVVRETTSGEMFAVVGEDKDFYVVQPSKGIKGYVFRTFILDGVVEGDRVNIRLSPDTEAPVIGRLSAGEKVVHHLCEQNNKWLEIQLPKTVNFYIAKEYLENAGPLELATQMETRQEQAYHLLTAAIKAAQAEIQKPFDEITLNTIHEKFTQLSQTYQDLPEIAMRANEAELAMEEAYVQKKIAFLEAKADRTMATKDADLAGLQKLTQMGKDLPVECKENFGDVGKATSSVLGHSAVAAEVTEKMAVWQSLEESLFHLWAVTHEGKNINDFYQEEAANATVLTGVVESFNKPVKNRPGDYILRADNLPVAFLYSTKINLANLIGKKVTLTTTPRPNNNFAFPAYFVIAAE
jgi:uncharacterized protein YgiM (DUF1202 family)